MVKTRPAGALILTIFCTVVLFAQTPQKPQTPAPAKAVQSSAKPDYSQEPFIIELYRNSTRFENDGTGVRELEVRVLLQSEAGVRGFGQLAFGYNSANEKMEINSVEVRKPDGSVTNAPPDAVQDMTAGVAREAPVYTDYRQKHVTVPALRPGDVLSYRVTTTIGTPLAPGQFWIAHDLLKDAIVLSEQFDVNIPHDRAIKLKTLPGAEPVISDEGARRIYRWKSSNLKRESDDEDSNAPKKKEKQPEFPAIQLTTFQSWAEVGVWYAGLERERAVATPAIRAKAEELVGNRKTDIERIEGLYSFVAKNFRYVSLSFGVGRYQPHSAEEVLANQYGDCKDKHTLLEALIEAIGLHADPVLASASRKIDPDVPSPGQFDHVFTVIRTTPDEKTWIWLDTTTEVAPFRLLSASLRKKQVLLVPMTVPGGAGANAGAIAHMLPRLIETPADPPFPATQRVLVQGQVSELGKLTAKISYTLRGDTELLLRSAFRRTPKPQWKDLGRVIVNSDGFRGDVSDVQVSDPATTEEAFHLEVQISEANFFDWSSHKSQMNLPLPRTGLPNAREADSDTPQADDPIDLGSPLEISTRAELELPATFKTQSPVPVSVSRDYADYSSSYKVEGNKVTAERTLRFRMRELPAARSRDYLAFVRAVRSDENQSLSVETASAANTGAGKTPGIPSAAKAGELYEAGLAALRNNNFPVAIELLKRVVELEPQHKGAWNNLGLVYLQTAELSLAEAAFRKQIEVNPYDEFAYNNLGRALDIQRKYDAAIEAYRKQIEINPLDRWAHANLGLLFVGQKRYSDAVTELERALAITPDTAQIEVALGESYLNLDQAEKATAALDKAVEHSPTPGTWNNVAYLLARKGQSLDRAQQYAESAVAAVAAELRNASLARLTLTDLVRVNGLAAYWDTLGWVLFQRGDLPKAELYVRASWLLSQHGEVGDHLAQIYEKQERKKESLDLYAQAVAGTRPLPETRTKLLSLVGDEKKLAAMTGAAAEALSAQRSIKLGNLKWDAGTKDTASAEFFIALESGASISAPPKVADVKFVSGDGSLRAFAAVLTAAHIPGMFPDTTPTQIVRRGILSCSRQTHECVFVMFLPENVHSVD